MPTPGKYDDFVSALQAVGESLDDLDGALYLAIRTALKEWAEETAIDAIDLLNRPNWLLSQFIGSKVVEYLKDRKVQAMAGFRFRQKSNRYKEPKKATKPGEKQEYIPDPGYYGRFFEGGKRRGGQPYSTRAKFLRTAKTKNIQELKALIDQAFDDQKRDLLSGKLDEIKKARASRRKSGDNTEPRDGYLS